MSNLVFPTLPGLVFPVTKTPMWKTDIAEAASGKETRVGFWSFPKWKWELEFEMLRDRPALGKDELWALIGFFNLHQGNFDSWLFNDPDDNLAADMAFGIGNGTETHFQLSRTRGGFVEPVKAFYNVNPGVDARAPTIKKAGTLQTYTTHYSLSSTGLVTFVTPPSNGQVLTWSGNFLWRCRFSEEMIDVQKFAATLWESDKIEFVSVK